jgi:hypothetical protein
MMDGCGGGVVINWAKKVLAKAMRVTYSKRRTQRDVAKRFPKNHPGVDGAKRLS